LISKFNGIMYKHGSDFTRAAFYRRRNRRYIKVLQIFMQN